MKPEIVLIGGGEHAAIVAEIATLSGHRVKGYVAPDRSENLSGLEYLGDDDALTAYQSVEWVLAIGATGPTTARRQIHAGLDQQATFATLVHPSAVVSSSAQLGAGVVIGASAVVQTGASIGDHVILGTGSVVEHDVTVGDHSVIGPSVTVGGGASIGSGVFVGMHAAIRDHVEIGDLALVGMGSIVTRSVLPQRTVMGRPANTVEPAKHD